MDIYNELTEQLWEIAASADIDILDMDLRHGRDRSFPGYNVITMASLPATNIPYAYRLAHEIAHILYGDNESQQVYAFSIGAMRDEEVLAHENAISMLIGLMYDYEKPDPRKFTDFVSLFGIWKIEHIARRVWFDFE